jgi:hypothetical protein
MRVTIHHFQAQIVSKQALLGQISPKKNQNSLQHPKTAKNRVSVYVSKYFLHIVVENIFKLSSSKYVSKCIISSNNSIRTKANKTKRMQDRTSHENQCWKKRKFLVFISIGFCFFLIHASMVSIAGKAGT